MTGQTITLTLPTKLYQSSQQLVDTGLFADLEDVVRAGLRYVLLEAALLDQKTMMDPQTDYERQLHDLRQEILTRGGLFPGQNHQTILNKLRQTREEVYADKFARHFGHE